MQLGKPVSTLHCAYNFTSLFVLNPAICKLNGQSHILPSSIYWLLLEDFWMSAYNTSILRCFFLRNKSIFSLLPSAWNVIIRPGTHCYFIVWQLQNKIEILHICCPESLCKILCWESVWSCISLGSLATKCSDLSLQQPLCPVPWKEAVAQHPAAQPTGCSRPGLQEKNTRQI